MSALGHNWLHRLSTVPGASPNVTSNSGCAAAFSTVAADCVEKVGKLLMPRRCRIVLIMQEQNALVLERTKQKRQTWKSCLPLVLKLSNQIAHTTIEPCQKKSADGDRM